VPTPVLGGCAIVMFGMTTVAGIQELSRVRFEGTRNGIIVAVSVSVGVLPMSFPALFAHASGPLQLVLESGIFLGAITAILLNVLLNNEQQSESFAEQRHQSSPIADQDPVGAGSGVSEAGAPPRRLHRRQAGSHKEGVAVTNDVPSFLLPLPRNHHEPLQQTHPRHPAEQDLDLLRRSACPRNPVSGAGTRSPRWLPTPRAEVIASAGNNSMPPEGDHPARRTGGRRPRRAAAVTPESWPAAPCTPAPNPAACAPAPCTGPALAGWSTRCPNMPCSA
jgi:hypothetical protein